MRAPCRRRTVRLATVVVLVLGVVSAAGANGFPHFAISLEDLLGFLDSPDPQHRQGAATSLGIRRERAAVEPLLAVTERPDEVEKVKVEAVEALAAIRDPRAVPRLVSLFEREPSAKVRAQIADALGDFGGPQATATLRARLGDDPSSEVRARAAVALGRLRDSGARALLEARLAAESDAGGRVALVQGLGLLGVADSTPVITALLASESEPRLRRAAALALGKLGDRRATAPLLSILGARSEDQALRQAAAVALAQLRDPASIPALESLLAEPDVVMIVLGIRALAETGRAEAVPSLVRAGLDAAREAAARRPGDSVEAFRRLVDAMTIRIEVVQALGRLGEPGGWPLIEQALAAGTIPATSVEALRLRERQYELRRSAILALAGMRDQRRAHRGLMRGLGDRDPKIRAEAARAVGLRGAREGVPLLHQALRDRDPEVRWEAAVALSALGAKEAVPALRRALTDPHPRVVAEAARSLGRLGAEDARASLEAILRARQEDEVREAAAEALSALRR